MCPYPGPAGFGPAHAEWFFGRDALVSELIERLDRRVREDGTQLVVAPPGAGKSSLLWAAGVHADGRVRQLLSDAQAGRVVVAADQFEDLFTLRGTEPRWRRQGAAGRFRRIDAPPCSRLCAVTLPLCLLAISLTSARPIP